MNKQRDYDPYYDSALVLEDTRPPIDRKSLISHPVNCKNECAYGRDRAFCFPCMMKIVEEHRAAREKQAKG